MAKQKTIKAFEEEFRNDPAQWEKFFDLIRAGVWISDACKELKRPYTLVKPAIDASEELTAKYLKALGDVAESDVNEVRGIADETPKDMVHVADKKVRIETRFKRAALYNRERFGERVDHKHSGLPPVLIIQTRAAQGALAEKVVESLPPLLAIEGQAE